MFRETRAISNKVAAIVTILCLAVLYFVGAAAARSTRVIPEFVLSRDKSTYCQVSVTIPPTDQDNSRERLFTFVDSARKFTDGWQQNFIIVDADYVGHNFFQVISYNGCSKRTKIADFINDFFIRWDRQHCKARCNSRAPRLVMQPNVPSGIAYRNNTFTSQINMFFAYRPSSDLSACSVMVHLPERAARGHFDSLSLMLSTQKKYRFPIQDISQIGSRIYLLFSRQCSEKRTLYLELLAAIAREGGNIDVFRDADFDPDIADYKFSETGER